MLDRNEHAVVLLGEKLRLEPDEAALYLHLSAAGPSKASELASALGLHRNEIYRLTEKLREQGLVEASEEQPVRYRAIDLNQAFEKVLASRMSTIDALRRTRGEIMGLMGQLADEKARAQSTYRVVHGRREIYKLRRTLWTGARSHVRWATSFPQAAPVWEASGEAEIVAKRCAEGVKVRALLAAAAQPVAQRLAPFPNVEVRGFESPGVVRFLVFDDRELVMSILNDPSPALDAEEEIAIHTSAPGFVHAQKAFFEQTWAHAAPVTATMSPTSSENPITRRASP